MPYIGTSPSNGVRRVHTYTATASQTTFTGASSEGVTLSYADTNYIDVFQNGVLLGSADYTSTSGTSVVLAQGASADDLIVIVVYDVFSVADTVSKTNGGSFDSAVTMSNNLTVNGALSAKGGVVFNEDSADVDFRVESNGNTHALFVDGGNDGVGIGTSSVDTNATMTVSNTGDNHAISIVGALNKSRIHFQGANTGSSSTDGLVIGLSSSDDTNDDSALIGLKESGSMSFQTNNTTRMKIDDNGEIGINESSPSAQLHITSPNLAGTRDALRLKNDTDNTGGNFIRFENSVGGFPGEIEQTGTNTVAYRTSSDHRLKENVSDMTDATTRLKLLKPKRFNFITEPDTTLDGFLAHEVQSVVPEAISGTHNGLEVWKEGEELPDGVSVGDNKLDDDGNTIPKYQGIDQSKLVPLLVKTIQELEARITALEKAE